MNFLQFQFNSFAFLVQIETTTYKFCAFVLNFYWRLFFPLLCILVYYSKFCRIYITSP